MLPLPSLQARLAESFRMGSKLFSAVRKARDSKAAPLTRSPAPSTCTALGEKPLLNSMCQFRHHPFRVTMVTNSHLVVVITRPKKLPHCKYRFYIVLVTRHLLAVLGRQSGIHNIASHWKNVLLVLEDIYLQIRLGTTLPPPSCEDKY